jgi:hypothetical protein
MQAIHPLFPLPAAGWCPALKCENDCEGRSSSNIFDLLVPDQINACPSSFLKEVFISQPHQKDQSTSELTRKHARALHRVDFY